MKKNLTEMVFILDKSGSMAGLEADTIGGFNSMIERQKQAEGEAMVSTVLFSNSSTVIHDRIDLRKIEPLTDRQYFVGGGTALIDAISTTSPWFTSTPARRTARSAPSSSSRRTVWRTPAIATAAMN